ncbi:MAG: NifB/NifX family molybdenum-iron cluster-binding protein [Opitutales bacterium]
MARPRKARNIESALEPMIYYPVGWTAQNAGMMEVAIEDFEVMRLVDGHAHGLEEAAALVGVSKSTAGRMLERARRAVALGLERRSAVYFDAGKDLRLLRVSAPAVDGDAGSDGKSLLAVACPAGGEDPEVERIFGRSARFALVDARDGTVRFMPNPGVTAARDAAGLAVDALRDAGVERVIAGRFGPEALNRIAGAGMRAQLASGLRLRQVIEMFCL